MEVVKNQSTSRNEPQLLVTQHGLLVALGVYAQQLGLIKAIEAVPIKQQTHKHSPQRKVIEFFVAILGGLAHLQDISQAAHPLDKDKAVAEAWGQNEWAHYSGVSRTLQGLSESEMLSLWAAIDDVEQPEIEGEIGKALQQVGKLIWDIDLTGRPVSSTSISYPDTAFGYMGDTIELGYQAALISQHSPTYGRLWLTNRLHSGDTVSATQLQPMIHAAEARANLRPRRRTELLQQRLDDLAAQQAQHAELAATSLAKLEATQTALDDCQQQLVDWKRQTQEIAAVYEASGRLPTAHCQLARARRKVNTFSNRLPRLQKQLARAERRQQRQQQAALAHASSLTHLQARQQQLLQDNLANPCPVRILLRLDAGFASRDNIAWLIEMGYEIYTKARQSSLVPLLKTAVSTDTAWQSVGSNASLCCWKDWHDSTQFTYPLNVALLRYMLPTQTKHAVLLHFGQDDVVNHSQTWFHTYNGRQTIEAGIKEGKNVFQMHHLKVRSPHALKLQERFACLAANLIRFAARWLRQQQTTPSPTISTSVKRMVSVAAHASAVVIRHEDNWFLRFSAQSLYAGHTLRFSIQPIQMPLPFEAAGFHFSHF